MAVSGGMQPKNMVDLEGFIKRNRAARENYRRLLYRSRDRVETLFIAESPPYPDPAEEYFWRIKSGEKPSYLLKYLLIAIYGDGVADEDAQLLLEQFAKDGYFLIDASEEPVNQIENDKERESAIEKNIGQLSATVPNLNPRKIIVIKRTIYSQVRRALVPSGYERRIIGEKGLPFPNNHHQSEFVKELRKLLGSNTPTNTHSPPLTRSLFLAPLFDPSS